MIHRLSLIFIIVFLLLSPLESAGKSSSTQDQLIKDYMEDLVLLGICNTCADAVNKLEYIAKDQSYYKCIFNKYLVLDTTTTQIYTQPSINHGIEMAQSNSSLCYPSLTLFASKVAKCGLNPKKILIIRSEMENKRKKILGK